MDWVAHVGVARALDPQVYSATVTEINVLPPSLRISVQTMMVLMPMLESASVVRSRVLNPLVCIAPLLSANVMLQNFVQTFLALFPTQNDVPAATLNVRQPQQQACFAQLNTANVHKIVSALIPMLLQ